MEFGEYTLQKSGLWTPTFTVFTPGNLSVSYNIRTGFYARMGIIGFIACELAASITHTTASGQVTVTGMPWAADADYIFPLSYSGITKASYTQFWGATSIGFAGMSFECGGSGLTIGSLSIADFPSGGNILLRFSGFMRIA